MTKLAIITTHPIQYNAPFFQLLSQRKNIELKVFYTWGQAAKGKKYDPDFGKEVEWNIPLLKGYDYTFAQNIALHPGSHHYKGINNPTLIKEIKEWGANALLVYGWNLKSHLAAMRYFKNKIPVFFRGDSTLLNETAGLKKIIRRLFLRYIYTFVDFGCYVGIANKAYYKAHGLKENQLIFMPHAVDNIRFENNEKNTMAGIIVRNKFAVHSNALVFLFAGKLDDNKNVGLLIKSFAALKSQNCFLLIAGTGVEEAKLKEAAAHFSNIKFIGFQNQKEMPGLYAAADVFVLPSQSETWGLSINEAMAAGNAIIASDGCGAVPDLLNTNSNGFLFKKNNVESLTQAMAFFIENKSAAHKFGLESKKIIEKYSFAFNSTVLENMALKRVTNN